MGATGGHFLAHLLIKAKHNSFEPMFLSTHGNAHGNLQDLANCPGGIPESDQDKIEHVLTTPIVGTMKPYFVPMHMSDIDLARKHFDKSIRITYESSDIEQLAVLYLLKYHIDVEDIDPNKYTRKVTKRIDFLQQYLPLFSELLDQNILCVSWKDLFLNDMEVLIAKLSGFAGIPASNFNRESIIRWRLATLDALNQMHKYL